MVKKIINSGLVFLVLSVIAFVLDYGTKVWVAESIKAYDFSSNNIIVVIDNFFRIIHVHNTGAAFSFLADQPGWQRIFFASIAITFCIVALVLLYKSKRNDYVPNIAYSLIIGGALGNLYDRLQYGYVIDFLDFYIVRNGREMHYPAFNVADMAICTAVGLILIYEFFFKKKQEPKLEQNQN